MRESNGGRPEHSILIVDDTVANLLAFSAILKSHDYRLVLAGSADEALRCALEEDFSVILMDVRMPQMNGFEAAEILRHRERTRKTPILFLSAYEIPPLHLLEKFVGGAVDFLPSPVDPDRLIRRISTILDAQDSRRAAEGSDPNLQRMGESAGGDLGARNP